MSLCLRDDLRKKKKIKVVKNTKKLVCVVNGEKSGAAASLQTSHCSAAMFTEYFSLSKT